MKNFIHTFQLLICLSLFSTYSLHAQVQLGLDIDGEAAGDQSGIVSLSADGTRIAIGAEYNDGGGISAGHVRIYEWNGTAWSKLGADIDGEIAGDQSGRSVSLSADGNRVAIGASLNDGNGADAGHVRIYEWNGTAWTQLGTDIDGEAADDQSGRSVSLSADGNRVAISAPLNDGNGADAGHVRIYEWNGTAWTQLGADINGEAAYHYIGNSVSLSDNGTRVAIGASLYDGNGSDAGHVRIYEWNGAAWTQLGAGIDGEAAGDQNGYSVSLSADGTRVAMGARFNAGNGINAGHVRIYEWNGTAWTQLGTDIDGEAGGDHSGNSVSLSEDGTRVAIGALLNNGNGNAAGHVRIYDWNGTAWIQKTCDIDGEAALDRSGYSVSLSGDGTRVAIGAWGNAGNGTAAGHVRIYAMNPIVYLSNPSTLSALEGTSCGGTKTITFDVTLDEVPSASTTVTLATSGTATLGTDYSISSTSLIFTNTTPQTVTLTINEDAVFEDDESIIVTINSVVGSDAAISCNNYGITFIFTITNDDPNQNAGSITFLSENFESGLGTFTTTSSGPTAFAPGNTSSASSSYWTIQPDNSTQFVYVNDDVCACDMSDVKLISPTLDLSAKTNTKLIFDHAFADVGDAFDVIVSTDNGATWGSSIHSITNTSTDLGSGRYRTPWVTGVEVDLSAYDGQSNVKVAFKYSDNGNWTYGAAIDNFLIITDNGPRAVQSTTNTVSGFAEHDLGAGEIVHFVDQSTGDIMCTIDNSASSHDYGCTRVEVDRAGTGAVEFNNSSASDYILSKSLKITPTNNTASDPNGYTITLYYTEAEVSGWEAATGDTRASIQILKVDGNNSITDVTAGNPGGLPITTAAATYATFGANHSFSASFTNGFSGFGAGGGGAALPVELMDFQARKDGKTALLTWATASEENNRGFHIERSANGRDFERIGWVDGAGTTAQKQDYRFVDERPLPFNYYRLAQEDFDGATALSGVRTLRFSTAGIATLFPNPSPKGGTATLVFPAATEQDLQVQVIDMAGRVVTEQQHSTLTGDNHIALPTDLTQGVYLINIKHANGAQVLKWTVTE